MKKDEIVIHIGVYYELPDGRIVYAYSCGRDKVGYYFENDQHGSASYEVFATWKYRPDLNDFPNSKDPVLPYVFDLYYDLKRMPNLKYFMAHEVDTKTLRHIKSLMREHKIKVS